MILQFAHGIYRYNMTCKIEIFTPLIREKLKRTILWCSELRAKEEKLLFHI